jgi:hypothetical protein
MVFNGTSGITVPLTGYYVILGQLYYDGITGQGSGRVVITVNDSVSFIVNTLANVSGSYSYNGLVFANATNVINLKATSFDPIRLYFGRDHTFFIIYYIG